MDQDVEQPDRDDGADQRDRQGTARIGGFPGGDRSDLEPGKGVECDQRDAGKVGGWRDGNRMNRAEGRQGDDCENKQRGELQRGDSGERRQRLAHPDDVEQRQRAEQRDQDDRLGNRPGDHREQGRDGKNDDIGVGSLRRSARDIVEPADDESGERSKGGADVEDWAARHAEMTRAVCIGQGNADKAEPGDEEEERREHSDCRIEFSGKREDAGSNHPVGGDEKGPADADRADRGGGLAQPASSRAASRAW